jgi:FixJ family two-component response regulator
MDGMSGVELHNHLMDSGYKIPTILITAFPDDRIRARALASGVVCYLSKTEDDDGLLRCIRLALEQPQS